MATIDVRPGTRPNITAGNSYRLLPGVHVPLVWSAKDVEIFGAEDPASSIVAGNRTSEFCLRGNDGCDNAHVHTLTLKDAGHGMRITVASGVVVEDIISTGHAVEGIHMSGVPGAVVRRVYAHDLGLWRFQTYSIDQSHGCYIAGNSDGAIVEDLHAENCGGSALQMNAGSTQDILTTPNVVRVLAQQCGRGGSGTLAFALMSVRDGQFHDFRLEGCHGIGTLFSDGAGASFACFENFFGLYTLVNTPPTFKQLEGSARNVATPGAGWSGMPAAPGAGAVTPTPPPPPNGGGDAALQAEIDRLNRLIGEKDEYIAAYPRGA